MANINDLSEEEVETCKKYGIEIIFGVSGYDKPNSSSWLIAKSKKDAAPSK